MALYSLVSAVRSPASVRRVADLTLGLAGAAVLLFYVNRIFPELPLYASDEGAYLIRALHGETLAARPELHPTVHPVGNTLYLLVARLVDALTLNVLPWLRLIGLAAYFGGLLLLHRVLGGAWRGAGLGALAVALAYPFYRFVVTAMPEGLYVLGLAALASLTAWLMPRRPWLHALLAGMGAATLVLLKPHGVAVLPAMAGLLVGAVVFRMARPVAALGQGALFAAAFLLTGAAIQTLAGAPGEPFAFFLGGAYADAFGRHPEAPLRTGLATALALGSSALLLTSLPAWAIGRALWRRRRSGGPAAPDELAGLFLLTAFAAALGMILLFAVKVSAIPGEENRLWGRYFEFYAPLLWIAAARPLASLWAAAGRVERIMMALLPLVGALGLLVACRTGLTLFPWDSAALSAFFAPRPERWLLVPPLPLRPLALVVVVAAALALVLRASPWRTWAAAFVAFGLLSTVYDDAWVGRDIAAPRSELEDELHVARALTDAAPGPAAVIAHDNNAGHIAFLRYDGQVHVRVRPPGPLPAEALAGFDDLVVIGPEAPPAPWRATFEGDSLAVFRRGPP